MTALKEVSSFANSTRVCDTDKTSNVESSGNDRRNEQRYLLMSTTYGLNASYTKKLHVGLQAINESCFAPIAKLTRNYVDGICLDIDTWEQFQAYMEHMSLYLNESPKIKPNPIIINNISVGFTTAYGTRFIIVTYCNEQAQPPMKKRKTYGVFIVMQKTTFQGLKNIVKCVNAHLSRLTCVVDSVNECAKYLIAEIELKLPASYINCQIIKLIKRLRVTTEKLNVTYRRK
ncbi:hypothetical protein ACFW04_006566 [Cataglyphis niger]